MPTARELAGLPLARWYFALRIWLAIHLALAVAFWVQLDGADSAGVAVAILAMQTRGQVVEKATFFFAGTVVGGVMGIVLAGMFGQLRELYIVVYSAWLALCVFAAGFLDGNRAYGAVLCGYTVSIVAVMRIDKPETVWSEAVNRCAAITIGIVCVTLVVDVLGGAEVGPSLIDRVGRARDRVREFTDRLLREGAGADTAPHVAHMLRVASDQHLALNALPVEAVSGSPRAGAIRATLAAMVGEVRAAHALAVERRMPPDPAHPALRGLTLRRLLGELDARREMSTSALAAAHAGHGVDHPPRMPVYRPVANAARNALRAFVASVITAALFVQLGWPQTCTTWAMVGVMISLSGNAPDPRAFSRAPLIAIPCAVVFGGLTEFLVLDGVDQLPLLMLGMAPALLAGLLLASSPKPGLASIGLLLTVYVIVVVSPSNPQNYDAESYILSAMLLPLSALLVFVLVRQLFPASDGLRIRWAMNAARRDMSAALRGRRQAMIEDEQRLLDASRIGSLVSLVGVQSADIAAALRMSDLARVSRRIMCALGHRPVGPEAGRIRTGLAVADADALRREADRLGSLPEEADLTLAADLALAADLIASPMVDAAA